MRKEGEEEEEEEEEEAAKEEAAISSASSVQEVDTWYAVCCCWLCGRVQEEWYSAACGAVRDSFLYSRFGSRFQEDLRV